MEETLQRLAKDMIKMRKKTRRLTVFAVIAGIYIIMLNNKAKEQDEKIKELNNTIGNHTAEGV